MRLDLGKVDAWVRDEWSKHRPPASDLQWDVFDLGRELGVTTYFPDMDRFRAHRCRIVPPHMDGEDVDFASMWTEDRVRAAARECAIGLSEWHAMKVAEAKAA